MGSTNVYVRTLLLDHRRWFMAAALLLAAFMNLLDASIVNLALPSIRDGLNLPLGHS